jgi:PAS domain S-box-containing protein
VTETLPTVTKSEVDVASAVQDLQSRLQEAEELLRAIRGGEVDAVVVSGPRGDQVYALSGAEYPYRVMVEAMSEGAVVVGGDGTIVYSNRSFAAMLDAPLDEVIGSTIDRLLLPEDLPRYEKLVDQSRGGASKAEIRFAARSGVAVPVYLSISSFESGTAAGACMVVTDLTKHKRHQALISAEALERTKRAEAESGQRRIASILESITDSFFLLNREWWITDANQRAAANFGRTRDELVGKLFWHVSPPGRIPELDEQYRRAMKERIAIHTEAPSAAAQGRWFERHIYPTDEGLCVYFRDITERRRREKELRRSEASLAEAQRLSHTGSWTWRPATGEVWWSVEHFRVFGVDPATFRPTQENAQRFIHPEDLPVVEKTLEKAVRDRADFEVDYRIIRPDGSMRYHHGLGRPLVNESGDLEFVGSAVDVTERKEEELVSRELLRRLVDAQEGEQRRIALEMHDQFGQQLSALVLKISQLKRERGRRTSLGEQLASLEAIARQLDTDLDLIVSRLRPPALDDLGLVAALTNYVKRWSAHFDIRADLHATGIAPGQLTDEIETALYRIAQEGLNNVAKHAQAAHVAILLDGRSDRVSLIVEDDGIGVDVEAAGSRDRFGVVGMRERAKLLGGTLDIESQPGKGMTVVARIPVPSDRERKST